MTNLNWLFRSRIDSDSPNSRGTRKSKSNRRRTTDRKRRMMLESLEGRRVLAVVGPGIDVAENQVFVTDIDDIGTVSAGPGSQYSISGGADAALFEVDAETGVLSFIAAHDFEMPNDLDVDNEYDVEVTLEDTLGNTDSISLSAIVLDVNEAPIANANGPYEINFGYDLLLDASGSFDVDAGDTLSYQWDLDGDDNADFVTTSVIDTVPGALVKSLTQIGDNTITLRVVDAGDLSATDTATLTVSSTLLYQVPTAAPGEVDVDDYTLIRNGAQIEIRETQSGIVVASGPYADLEEIQVLGSPRPNILTVDNQGGAIVRPISFDGAGPSGTPIGDELVLANGTADVVQHNFTNESDGSIAITFSGESSSVTLSYTNLEPVVDNLNAANRVFTFVGGSETITLSDDGVVGNNFSRIDSTLGEVVTFLNPTNSLTVNAGTGNDVINVSVLDSLYAASLIINGGAGSDVLDIDGLQIVNSPGRGLEINSTETTTISNSQIEGNTATIGGGLLVNGAGTVTIDNSRFENNSATGVLATQGGGGIFNNGAVMTIQNGSVVSGNTAIIGLGSGGGIFSLGTLTVTDSFIDGNDANRAGGGIEIGAGSLLTTLTSTSLADNNALVGPGNGGGMHITGAGDSLIMNGFIGNNFAAEEGGGLWNGTGTMTIDNSIIENNVANAGNNGLNDQGGGGVFNNGGTLVIQNFTDVRFNSAPVNAGNGGGVMTVGGSVSVNSSSVLGNDAARAGGGIENNGGVLSIDFGTIGRADIPGNGNTANINGGGIHVSGAGTTNLQNSVVQGNLALQEGGGLWNSSGGLMTVVDSTIDQNTASGALSDQGGGGVFNAGGQVSITNTLVAANIAGGALGSGGGILNDGGGTLSVTDLQLVDNRANRAGGGIEATAGTTTTLTRVNLDRNNVGIAPAIAAPGNGGGLHVTGNGNVAIVGGTVADNVAAQEGGGLWNGSGTMTIDGTSIVGNVASGDAANDGGGGVFNNAGVLDINNALIQLNQADGLLGSGGGVFSLAGSVTIDNTTIDTNSANRAGGGVEVVVGTVAMTDSDLTGNDVNGDGTLATAPNPGNGGGLHTSAAAAVSILRGSVVGNVAASEGGGLWNSSTGTLTITGTVVDQNMARSAGAAADAQGGGGIFNNGGELNVLAGTRITNNTALDPDAGATQDDGGGGIFNNGGVVVMMGPGTVVQNNLATDGLGNGGGVLSFGGTVTVTDVVFDSNTAARAGGAIENNGGNVTLNSVTITANNAGINGGGLHAAGASTTTVSDGLFQANVAGQEGGGLWNGDGLMTIDATTITANVASSGANAGNDQGGGGVFNIGGTLDIDDAVITNNLAAVNLGNGGGVMSVGGIVTIDGGEISGNQAARAGGGIENNAGNVTVTNVNVRDNTADVNGGGLHASGATSVTSISGGLFQNNTAMQEGGGLWNGDGAMTIVATTIDANTATSAANVGNDQGGGGVFNVGGTLSVANAAITNNLATANNGNGGGVMTVGGVVTITGGSIAGNQAARAGGGIENNDGDVSVTNVLVENNSAGVNGGGLHASGAASVTSVVDGVFRLNVAGQEGGGLWNGPGTMSINGTSVTANTANSAANAGNDQGGGGVFNIGGTLVIVDASITSNVATSNNGNGGGVMTVGGSVNISGGDISDNQAARAGGGIENNAGSATLGDVSVQRNTAGINGGGLHASGAASVTSVSDGVFVNNVAGEEGGGLWNGPGAMSINGTAVTSNIANSGANAGNDQGGGGVFNIGGTLDLVDATVSNNVATANNGNGGGVMTVGGIVTINGGTIAANDAARAGGGIENNGGNVTVTDVSVRNNTAGVNGGGLHASGVASITSVSGGVFHANTAAEEGGGLWNGPGQMTISGTSVVANVAFSGANAGNDQGGGGVFNIGGSLSINNAAFADNRANANNGNGGGLMTVGGTVAISGGSITGNLAARAGGGIENNAAVVTINNVSVQANSADVNGGGLHVSGAGTTTVNGGLFQNNIAAQEGGGLWNSATGTLNIIGTTIDQNIAQSANSATQVQGGGGVFNDGGVVDIRGGARVTDNSALDPDAGATQDDGGGGILNNGGMLTIADLATVISGNSAIDGLGNGGGILTIGGVVEITDATISGNAAARAGGGIENNAGVVTLSSVTVGGPNVVDGNRASVNGGGLHVSGTATTNVNNGLFQNNGASEEGGGLWNSSTGTMAIVGTEILDNSAFGNGTDQGGGGVFNAGGTLSISGAAIRRNVADGISGSGGGVLNDVGGNLTVVNSAITDNVANRAGGGIETVATTTTTLTNVSLDGNNAGVAPTAVGNPGNGGGLHVSGNGVVTITGGTVNNNVANEEGGGLWNGSSTMTVTGTQIDGNQANGSGADQGGGGVFNSSGTLNLVNVQLTNNIANTGDASGGGGFNDQGTLNVRDSTITGNDLCALSYVRPSGTVINNNFSGNVGGALCPLLGTANDDVIVVTSTVIAINADTFTYDDTLGPIDIESRDGNDRFDVRSTAAANPITIDAGTGDDEINISSDAPDNESHLDQILGDVTVIGGANLSNPAGTAITAKSTTIGQALVVGDTLNISDNGSAADNIYSLGANTFRRSGVLPSGLITFNTIESLNIITGIGSDTLGVTSTPASASISILTGDGNDNVTIDTTGNGSVLRVDTQAGDDTVTLNGGGANAAAELRGGIDSDRFDIRSTGSLGALVGIGGLGDDTFAVSGTSAVTSTDLFGDELTPSASDGADTFDFGHTLAQVGSAATGTVAGLLGAICVDGGSGPETPLSADVTSRHASTRPETISQNVLLSDAIIYSDAAASGPTGQTYTVTDTTLERAGAVTTIIYDRIESVTMRTSAFDDTIAVESTVDAAMLGIVSGGGNDTVTVGATGDGSITAIQTGLIEGLGSSDNDTVTIQSTGIASILEIDTDFATPSSLPPASVSDADLIFVLGRGTGSGMAIRTGSDQDEITIGGASAIPAGTTGTRSLVQIESGDDDDTFTVNEVFLETVVDLRGDAGNDTFDLIATGSDATGNLGRLNNDPINGEPLDEVARTRELLIDGGSDGAGTRSIVEGVSVSSAGAASEGLVAGLPTGDTINVNASSATSALDLRYVITANTNGVLVSTVPSADPNARQTEGNEVLDALGVENVNLVTGGGDDVLTVSGTVPLGIASTGQVVRFDGNGADDRFEVLGGDSDDRVTIGSIGDSTDEPFEIQNVSYIRVDGGNGDDQVANDTSAISVLDGGLGNDAMLGGSEQDVLTGGGGSDAIFGRGGNDILLSDQDFGDDTLIPAPGDVLDGGVEDGLPGDICVQVGADRVSNCEVLGDGGAEKDVLTWLRAILVPIGSISFADNDPQFEPFGPVAARPTPTLSTTEPSALSPAVAFPVVDPIAAPISVGATPGEGEMRLDVNGDGQVTALDALRVINAMSRQHSTIGVEGETVSSVRAEADVNADGQVSGLDALLIINELARSRARGESEAMIVDSSSDGIGEASLKVNEAVVASQQLDDPSDIVATDKTDTAASSAWATSVDEFFSDESDDRYASDKEYEKLTIEDFFKLSSDF